MHNTMDGMTPIPQFAGLELFSCAADEIKATVRFGPDSPWFSGHFPNDPILPGIAQLGTVFDAILQASGQQLWVTGLNRVRFKKLVRPGEVLTILAAPAPNRPGTYSFRITVDAQEVCVGMMMVNTRDK
jgi:3-hydroxymyristoyl/3-hydroxydecanoyl-(acyl carrier protein) dehydratase